MAFDYDTQTVHCDHCKTPQPPTQEVLKQGGLIAMGWRCSGGTHVCPDCKKEHTNDRKN